MNTLFPIEPNFPQGFLYYPDFLTEDEEMRLYKEIAACELHNLEFHGFKASRRIASFGYDYNFENNNLSEGKPIPGAFNFIIEKVAKQLSINPYEFAELLITEYPAGSVINWHRDAPPFDLIAGISLLADCIFRLRPYDKAKQNRKNTISFPVAKRSLYVIRNAARTDWQHSIAPVKEVRYSLTLRTLRNACVRT